MIKIEKLSEKNLCDVIIALFPNHTTLTPQKRFKGITQTFIVDYFLEICDDKIVFEFDGPTHYTNSKTQLRDIHLGIFCRDNNFSLVRIPYFAQIDDGTLPALFSVDLVERYDLFTTIKDVICEYVSGFYDDKIVYPGNFNHYGWTIFWKFYLHLNQVERMSVMKQIYRSLEGIEANIAVGIGWTNHEEKKIFFENFPS